MPLTEKIPDFGAGLPYSAGCNHPHLVKALTDQFAVACPTYIHSQQQKLAERLVERRSRTPCSSAIRRRSVEASIVVRSIQCQRQSERCRTIAFKAFTAGRLRPLPLARTTRTGRVRPRCRRVDHVAFGNMNEGSATISAETAGIMVEPIRARLAFGRRTASISKTAIVATRLGC